ncbi:redoxin domain-containing protein [Aquimarina rubra]|uniref:Redoxin domain-containing protein n=1 Tax=Aquimarina rubra TaxID=1920033 RepID=A0ABW5LA26_9FLAO
MNSKKHYTLLSLLLIIGLLVSCNKEKKTNNIVESKIASDEYLISGTLKNIEDSTWIFINKDNEIIDSTRIINEKFEFKGTLDEPSSFFMMVGKTKPEYFVLWAENLKMKIEGDKGNIRNVSITGSKSQNEYNILKQRTDSLELVFENVISQLQNPDPDKMTNEIRNNLIKEQNDILTKIEEINQKFILDFPNSYVSASNLNDYAASWGREKVDELHIPLSEQMKNSSYGQSIKHFLSLPEVPEVGEKFIDFELTDLDDTPLKISDNKSKYTLIEFWASWCYPCRQENPKLIKTYNQYKDQGFEIIGVSIDQRKEDWIKAIKKDSLPWKQGVDLKGFKSDIALTYGINGIPDNFLIDEEGKIIAKTLRGNQLENKLKELFKN